MTAAMIGTGIAKLYAPKSYHASATVSTACASVSIVP